MNKKVNFLETLLILYLSFGMLKGINLFHYFDYVISLILQLVCIINTSKNGYKISDRKILFIYIIIIFEILLIMINFISLNVEIVKIINRILPLLSVFGLVIITENKNIDINKVLKKTKKNYYYLGIILIFDYVCYLLLGIAIWPPSYYLGYRYAGPFYDANFLSITYGVMLILEIFNKEWNKKYILVFILCILLGMSWSAICILVISFTFNKFFKCKRLFLKQLFLVSIYIVFLILITKYNTIIQQVFCDVLTSLTSYTEFEALIKYNSFYYRIEAQLEALELFLIKPLGYGPLQIGNYIGMDVHNSYVAFVFEMGITSFILQLTSLYATINKKNKMLNVLSSFILLMSFTINIHYSIIYSLLLLLIHKKEVENNEEKLFICS